MATYNGEKYIIEQLESIIRQSVPIDECIICDDKSEDRTVELINEFIKKNQLEDKYVVYVNEENTGYIETFKKAIGLTKGDYVYLSDQDDCWKYDRVEKCAAIIENDKSIKVLACSYDGMDCKGERVKTRKPPFAENHGLIIFHKFKRDTVHKISAKESVERCLSMGCTMVVSRSVANEYVSYKKTRDIPHDWELSIRAAIQEGLYFYNRPVIDYRFHDNNTLGMKAKNQDMGIDYRISEYTSYIHIYDEIGKIIEDERIKKHIRIWKKFFIDRRDGLATRKITRLFMIFVKYAFLLGIKVSIVCNDILVLKHKNGSN